MDLKGLIARAAEFRTDQLTVDGIDVRVREPTAAVHARYSGLWMAGEDNQAFAHLLRHCVVDDSDVPCLSDTQAATLATAGSELAMPIINRILKLAAPEKKPDAPAADAVQDQLAAGAPSV